MIGDATQHVGKPSLEIDVVELGGFNQSEHRSGTFPSYADSAMP